ncbi:pre-mRNA-processing factor 39-like [Liolophura sinensis]|uniref:pre-mRNA-processing factor 39-like n=1 Tax=Liolophura sinensis TaxID=3198878 RepID=UPI0031597857
MADTEQESATDNEKSNPEEPKQSTELEKYWKAVKDNPSDFTGWTYLLQYVEQENKGESAREAFDEFFSHYPYCFGYWKKYADLEKRLEEFDKAEEVFERGLKAIPLSVELWLHYLCFLTEKHVNDPEAVGKIRSLYTRALATAGKDFRSDKLWDSFIKWEKDQNELVKVTALYDQLLSIPTQLYSHHFDNFKLHVESNHPKDILTLDEFLKLRQEVVSSASSTPALDGVEEEEAPPGVDDGPPGVDDAPPGLDSSKVTDAELPALRAKIIETRQAVHKLTEEEVSKRWAFEEAIKRPYFHVKPLERAQLKNWREYLDFEIENGCNERVVVLFERCMIACALYEDFWLKYARYLEPHSVEAVKNVYRRACKIHLPKKPNIHLAWAAFEEKQGNHDEAWEILSSLEKTLPKLAMVRLRRISLERRRGNYPEVEQIYRESIEEAPSLEVHSFFALKYARYLSKVLGKVEKAKEVLNKAVEKDKKNTKLYLQLIDTEYQCQPLREERIIEILDIVINNDDIPLSTRVNFSQRKLEFMEDFGNDIIKLSETYEHHQKLLKEYHSQKKRKQEENTEGEPNAKKAKEDYSGSNGTSASHHVTSAGDTQQQQHHNYAYSHWPGYTNPGYGYQHSHWGAYNASYYPS